LFEPNEFPKLDVLLFEPKEFIPPPNADEVLFPNPVLPKADELEFPKPLLPNPDVLLLPNDEVPKAEVLLDVFPNDPNAEVLLVFPNAELLPKLVLPNTDVLELKLELFTKVEFPKAELLKFEELLPKLEFPKVVLEEFPKPVFPNANELLLLLLPNIELLLLLLLLPNALEVFPKEKDVLPNMAIYK